MPGADTGIDFVLDPLRALGRIALVRMVDTNAAIRDLKLDYAQQ